MVEMYQKKNTNEKSIFIFMYIKIWRLSPEKKKKIIQYIKLLATPTTLFSVIVTTLGRWDPHPHKKVQMRMRILTVKNMRIHADADPDPQP